ncbi:MAG TPA: carboxypeptidase-like regulatory domain-containing protein, partial [Ilumatobacteraceae bacterium]|nr:carboxypeptidase-like regulatory domain-containing protein [Ilumatobacteraceae bacterium]
VDDLGAPIANARVALDPRAWFVGASVTTDANGRYRFMLNEASVTAHTLETYAVSGYTKRAAGDARSGAFHTGTSQNYSTWNVPDLVLDRNGAIEGDVMDDSAVPVAIAGAGVFTEYVGYWANCDPNYAVYCTDYRQYYNGGTVVYEASTDAAGRYRVSAPALPDVVVKPRKTAGYTTPGDAMAIGVPIGGLAVSDVDFVYLRQATVTGTLTTNAGALPAVRIYYDGYDDFYSSSTHSSDHRYTGFVDVAAGAGSYSIGAPSGSAGSFRVYVQDFVAGFGYGFPSEHDVPAAERSAGATAAGKDFAWKAFATVTGHVNGLPPGTNVQLHLDSYDSLGRYRQFSTSTTNGTFTLSALDGTAYVYVDTHVNGFGLGGAESSTTRNWTITTVSGATVADVDFDYLPWVAVTGSLTGDVGSLPSAPYMAGHATDKWGSQYYFEAYAPSGGGAYTVSMPAGVANVYYLPGYTHWLTPQQRLNVNVPAAGLTGLDFVWIGLATIDGTLRNPDGTPIGGGYVTLTSPSPQSILTTWVYLDPAALPREIMLQFYSTAQGWNHRAYWGEDLIGYGTNGTQSRLRIGDLPVAGEWARLDVSAAALGLEGLDVYAMSFDLYDGQAWWDATSVDSLATDVAVWVDDATPPSAGAYGDWTWDVTKAFSGTQSHRSPNAAGWHQQYFSNASPQLRVPGPAHVYSTYSYDGNYTVEVVPDTYTIAPPTLNPYATPAVRTATVTALTTTTVDFAYLLAGTFQGTVTVGGAPLAGARICDDFGNCGDSDGAGNYSFRTPIGNRTLTGGFVVGHAQPAQQGPFAIALGTTQTVDFAYVANASLTIHVQDDLLAPLQGATVSFTYYSPVTGGFLHRYTAVSDAAGVATLSVPHGGGRTIVAEPLTGYRAPAAQTVSVVAGALPAPTFTYDRNGSLSGVLLDRQGNPVAGVTVDVFGPVSGTTTSGADGTYSLAELTPGSYSVHPRAKAGYVTPAARSVSVPVRGNVVADFEYVKQAHLVGRVEDDLGQALAGVSIWLGAYVSTDSNGRFDLFTAPGD